MKTRSPITTHILDQSIGKPAAGVGVLLEKLDVQNHWLILKESATNADGRVEDLLAPGSEAEPGTYRMSFEVGTYFRSTKRDSFYPYVSISFEIKKAEEYYHVPLLLSPYGYSTYRGS